MMNLRKLFKRTERAGRSLFITLMLVMFSVSAAAQDGKLKGNVTGTADGEPLIGVSVVVKGTAKGSITDYDGNYTLSGLKRGDVIVFSYVGYLPKEQAYTGQSRLDVKLKEDSKSLDDLVVIGYGTMKKKLVTGATMQLKGDDIQKLNTVNPLSAMQGQTPGVNIVSTSGQPGSAMSVTIRGLGTVGNSQPLYLIDGIAGDITNLNPADIERIDVLKDAASAAIYGAQAANGVILVTTKSGKEGSSKISYDGYVGWQTVGRKFDMLNSREYMTIMDEARVNSGMSPVDWASLNSIHDANGNIYDTDWIDNAIDDGALTTSHNLSFLLAAPRLPPMSSPAVIPVRTVSSEVLTCLIIRGITSVPTPSTRCTTDSSPWASMSASCGRTAATWAPEIFITTTCVRHSRHRLSFPFTVPMATTTTQQAPTGT